MSDKEKVTLPQRKSVETQPVPEVSNELVTIKRETEEVTPEPEATAETQSSTPVSFKPANFNMDIRTPIDENPKKNSSGIYKSFEYTLVNGTPTDISKEYDESWGDLTREEKEEKISTLTLFGTPNDIGSLIAQRSHSDWANFISGPTKKIGTRVGGNVTRARALISTLSGGNQGITMFMPASGFYVEFKSPNESDLCDFDFKLSQENSIVGVDTSGMLLSATSAVNVGHLFNFALEYVTDCTLTHNKEQLSNTIRTRLKSQDHGLFVLGPLIAKFIGGFPFDIVCPAGKCNHVRDIVLNLARVINYDRFMISHEQAKIVERCSSMGSMSQKDYDEYQAEHSLAPESRILLGEVEGNEIYLTLKECSIGYFIEQGLDWVSEVEDSNNLVLATFATEVQRAQHINLRSNVRKLMRYKHLFNSIEIIGVDGDVEIIDDRKELLEEMESFAGQLELSARIQRDIGKFVIARQISLIGYMATECEACKRPVTPGEEFVSLSPDMLFFMLSQAVSSVQQVAAEVQKQSH